MTSPEVDPAWKRLGEQLIARRLVLDPAYRNRRVWCAATGLNYRLVVDLERGLRDNYTAATITAVERKYQVEPGSFKLVLDGGDLQPAVIWDHPHDRAVWELHEIPEHLRRHMIGILQGERARQDRESSDKQGNRHIP